MVKLGDRAKDVISGLKGIVVGRTEWLYGCARIGLQPEELKDGKPVETQWFDEAQVGVVKRGVIKAPALAAPVTSTGGPDRREETK